MSTLSFEPSIDPALWSTLALGAAVLLAWYGWHRLPAVPRRRWFGIVFLMAAGLAAVLTVLLNPTWTEPVPPPAGKPLLTVLLDRSASMATDDAEGDKTRFSRAAEIARSLSDQLGDTFDVRLKTFAESAASVDVRDLSTIQPDGRSTDLAAALASSLDEDRPQGQAALVLSDGIHNAAGGLGRLLDVVRTAKAMAAPVCTTTIGRKTRVNDLELGVARAQDLAFLGQTVPVTVLVRQRGRLTGQANVVLMQADKQIDRRTVSLTVDGTATIPFKVTQAAGGMYRYVVRAQPVASEATTANNAATFVLRVIEAPIRVLLLEGKPYWDAKFLMRVLAADPSLELDCIVRLTDNRYLKRSLSWKRPETPASSGAEPNEEDKTPDAGPVHRIEMTSVLTDPLSGLQQADGLEAYQILILGRDSEVFLTRAMLDRLRTWISHDGGALVCYRGSPVANVSQELGRLLPVRWVPTRETRFRMQWTQCGRDLNWLVATDANAAEELQKLPSLASVARPERPKPLAVVLAKGEGDRGPPAVTYQLYGTGRVVAVEGAGMWRWAFLPPEHRDHDATYGALWQSLVRWLVSSLGLLPGEKLALRMDKVAYTTDEAVAATLLMREDVQSDAIPTVQLRQADQTSAKTFTPVPVGEEPGVYQVVFGRLPEGQYRADLSPVDRDSQGASTTVTFDVRPFLAERLDVAVRSDIMSRIASASGGTVIEDIQPSEIGRQFREHIARTRPERVRRITAWDRWWILLGTFVVWGAAWGLRRSSGLV